MTGTHWAAIFCTGLWILGLLFFTLRSRQGGCFWRLSQRVFWSFAGVWLCNVLGLIGLNAVTSVISLLFGVPGVLAMITMARF